MLDERQLAEAMQRLTPEPPRPVTLSDVIARLSSAAPPRPLSARPTRRWMPLLTAAAVTLVTAISVGLIVLLENGHHPPTPTTTLPPPITGPSPTAPTQAPLGRVVGPWHAALVSEAQLPQGNLPSDRRWLYALTGTAIVRIDPASGEIDRETSFPSSGYPPSLVDGRTLWIATTRGGSRSVVLHRFRLPDLTPLAARTVPFPGAGEGVDAVGLASSPNGRSLYLGAGHGIAVIDASTAGVVRRLTVSVGTVTALTVTPDEATMYVATNNASGSHLEALDVATGAVQQVAPYPTSTISGLSATSGGVFVSSGTGMEDSVDFVTPGHLRYGRPEGSGGGGISTSVTIARGMAWIGGLQLTCADPHTGQPGARAEIPSRDGSAASISGIAFADGHFYAVYDSPAAHGLVRLRPPVQCLP
jgi:hypothetical protein